MSLDLSPAQFDVPATEDPQPLDPLVQAELEQRIADLLIEKNATIIAHVYVAPEIQALAERTGGLVSDSLQMARFGRESSASTLVVAGVRFMGESAKILSPDKRVLMPTLEANCSLDLGLSAEDFAAFKAQHPGRISVVYANTSAAVKAQADWVVTSSNAIDIIEHLDAQGEKILWAPDRYLGGYIQKETGADMVLWQGSCVVHEEFKAESLRQLKAAYPEAGVLVHPESPPSVIKMADVIGSTSKLIAAVGSLDFPSYIVATDRGIFYKMQQMAPDKTFHLAPTGGAQASCRSCGHCPWMAMNALQGIEACLRDGTPEIELDQSIIEKALIPLERMVHFQSN